MKSQTATLLWPSGFFALSIVLVAYRKAAGSRSAAICAHINFDECALCTCRNIKLNIVAAAHPKGPRHILIVDPNSDVDRRHAVRKIANFRVESFSNVRSSNAIL